MPLCVGFSLFVILVHSLQSCVPVRNKLDEVALVFRNVRHARGFSISYKRATDTATSKYDFMSSNGMRRVETP